jgi:hypothetical protein
VRRIVAVAALSVLATLAAMPGGAHATTAAPTSEGAADLDDAAPRSPTDPFVLAHYYLWYTASSWNRAKSDYPLIGRYSSDEVSVMRRHIQQAKAAGIDGFIVSWKSTDEMDQRLANLVALAEEQSFKLSLTYQGLDFNRDPLPAERVADDLESFLADFGSSPAFDIFGRPLVAWTGTWEFSTEDVKRVTDQVRGRLLVLATEKNVEGYQRLARFVDGDLYYWASANPQTYPDYRGKLAGMADTVRAHDGLWIAPAAPGFDARMVGGEEVVERRGGSTLREQWEGAMASLPDAIGLISWNEFSENTHIEPSESYGATSLQVVGDLTGAPTPAGELDSSGPSVAPAGRGNLLLIPGFIVALVAAGIVVRRLTRPDVREPSR